MRNIFTPFLVAFFAFVFSSLAFSMEAENIKIKVLFIIWEDLTHKSTSDTIYIPYQKDWNWTMADLKSAIKNYQKKWEISANVNDTISHQQIGIRGVLTLDSVVDLKISYDRHPWSNFENDIRLNDLLVNNTSFRASCSVLDRNFYNRVQGLYR